MDIDKKNKNNKKTLLGFLVGFIIVCSFFPIFKINFNDRNNIQFETELQKIVDELNKKYPIQIDELTTIDNIKLLPNKTIQFNYTLGLELSEINVNELHKLVYPNTINDVKNNPDTKIYRDNDVTFIYFYKDINGSFLMDWTITPDLYK